MRDDIFFKNGEILVILEDIYHDGKLYFREKSHVTIINIFKTDDGMVNLHVRVDETKVHVLYSTDKFLKLDDYIKLRDGKIDSLIGKND